MGEGRGGWWSAWLLLFSTSRILGNLAQESVTFLLVTVDSTCGCLQCWLPYDWSHCHECVFISLSVFASLAKKLQPLVETVPCAVTQLQVLGSGSFLHQGSHGRGSLQTGREFDIINPEQKNENRKFTIKNILH